MLRATFFYFSGMSKETKVDIGYIPDGIDISKVDQLMQNIGKANGHFKWETIYNSSTDGYYQFIAENKRFIEGTLPEDATFLRLTQRGYELLDLGGYSQWADFSRKRVRMEMMDEENKVKSLEASQNSLMASWIIGGLTVVALIIQVGIQWQDKCEQKLLLESIQQISTEIHVLHTRLDSVDLPKRDSAR